MDVGFYLSQVFIRNHPSLKWPQYLGGKTRVDYGQPLLVGFGVLSFNPIRMVLAGGIPRWTGTGLRELYDIWSEDVG